MDRFYTSPELFSELRQLNIGACVKYYLFFNKKAFKGTI